MKKTVLASRLLLVFWLCVTAGHSWAEEPAPAATVTAPFPAPGKWRFSFAPGSVITFFLKGNIHDTLGYVEKIDGGASAAVTAEGRLADPAVQFTFAADTMDSKDEKRDRRMKTKFMETGLYPRIAFRSTGAGPGLQGAAPVAGASKEKPVAFDLQGDLTIHGVTRSITVPVAVYPHDGLLVTEGAAVLYLRDFSIKNPSFFIFRTAEDVKIEFHIELQQTQHTPGAKEPPKQ